MDTITDLLTGNNYIWLIVILGVILIAFIGYIADKANKRRKNSNKNNGVKDNSVELATPTATAVEEPETIGTTNDVTPATIQDTMVKPEESGNVIVDQPINNIVNDQGAGTNLNNTDEMFASIPNSMPTPGPISIDTINPEPMPGSNGVTETIPEPMMGLGEAQASIRNEETPIVSIPENNIPINTEEPINMNMGESTTDNKDNDVELLS